ncbi:homogentisate solanesyltransferase, chloroplastic-like [Morus notabilis]|uniref:homogentisate solanesyltransferase, chloroplastic-like n=1 Tax=Morus notabilis TaxID=981085 RepID=UPI000CED6109|nr:homogentisate solanesyltransferase, chloroplastic-like [Morus notabilis]
MALKISHSSLRLPIRSGTKNIKSSNFPSKCSTNRLILPVRIRGKSWFSKCLLFGQYKRNSIRARLEACPKLEVARVLNFGSTCYKFARPYAMLQVIVSSISFIARILVENKQLFKWSLLLKAIPCLTAMILGHAYSNGLNQIFDADIDRVNKPYLPISAGDLSIKQAWFLVIFYALAGQLILRLMNADLIITCLYCSALLLTTMYSAPPFRFKESSVTTIIMIPLVLLFSSISFASEITGGGDKTAKDDLSILILGDESMNKVLFCFTYPFNNMRSPYWTSA